jgi:hypothetical protein
MLIKFMRLPIRCFLSLSLALLLAVPEAAFSEPVQGSGVTKLNLVIVEGEGAINNVRQRIAREPIVQVEDENRKPIAGAAVIFTLPESGPSGTFSNGSRILQVTTNSKGQAVAKGLKLNNVSGKFQIQVQASYQGASANATISQANAVLSTTASGMSVAHTLVAVLAATASGIAVGVAIGSRKGNTYRAPTNDNTGRDR